MNPEGIQILVSAFLLGLMGSVHCLGMCGGLASALGLNTGSTGNIPLRNVEGDMTTCSPSPTTLLLGYNVGRVSSYALAGLIVGLMGFWLSQTLATATALRYIAAIMLILMGCYIGQWFNGLIVIEKLGQHLWRRIQPLARRLMPITTFSRAFSVGMVWGWLPCGLVYSALIWAGSQGNAAQSALVMICFGLGTLPSMLATGYFANQVSAVIRNQSFRNIAGGLMILFGLWSLPIVHGFFYTLAA